MRRTGGVSNDVVEGRVQARLRSLHRSRLLHARAVVGSGPGPDQGPPRFAHLDSATKAAPREARVRSEVIARDNSLLVDKMCHILARRPQANHDPALLAAARKATAEDAYRPGPIPLPKSLNKEARTRKLEQIVLENEKFLNRLISSPGVLSRQQWQKRAAEEMRYLDLHCKFPYADPQQAMPVVNPMLAIANAQSNKAAEAILRNQQALQQQQQQLLPQLHAAPQQPSSFGFGGPSHSNFGASFGSSFGSTSSSSHLPAMYGALQPVPPHTARPASSTTGPAQPRLRAQYTSQGVRIIRTGRSGQSTARPSTSLDPLRHGAVREAHKDAGAKFQPLRSQQLQPTKSASPRKDKHKDEQKEAAPASSAEADTTKAPAEDAGAQSALAAAADAGPDGAASSSGGSSGSGPAEGVSTLLFEDTLVISSRPVLVRVSEVGHPWRLDVRVFDPYSSLEYNLSLPLTFIRMCMYQVPDLLLEHNRKFLVQTLLHYLVFVQTDAQQGGAGGGGASGGGGGGLELLVDIVAPPPRNAMEAAAWARVQEEAAIEQANWELDNEREAARARRELQQHTQQQQLEEHKQEQEQTQGQEQQETEEQQEEQLDEAEQAAEEGEEAKDQGEGDPEDLAPPSIEDEFAVGDVTELEPEPEPELDQPADGAPSDDAADAPSSDGATDLPATTTSDSASGATEQPAEEPQPSEAEAAQPAQETDAAPADSSSAAAANAPGADTPAATDLAAATTVGPTDTPAVTDPVAAAPTDQ